MFVEVMLGIMFYCFMAGITGKIYQEYHNVDRSEAFLAGAVWPILLPIHIGIWTFNQIID